MTERQREIVLGYAECSMNAVETGRKLYLSYVTVGYHLNQIKKSTGIDPRSFWPSRSEGKRCIGSLRQ